jgi:hypothetical protein
LFGIEHLQRLLSLGLEKVALTISAIVPTFQANEIKGLMRIMSKRLIPAYSHNDQQESL